MPDFDYESFWPTPSSRWGSFEAEAFPLTAYRYDSRGPYDVQKLGPHTASTNPETAGIARQFGDDTVYAAASREGLHYYFHKDSSTYRPLNESLGYIRGLKHKIAYDPTDPLPFKKNKIVNGFLYRIKTNTHNAVPFRDLNDKFRKRFITLTLNNRSYENLKKDVTFDKYNELNKLRDIVFEKEFKAISNRMLTYINNDEIHVRGTSLPIGVISQQIHSKAEATSISQTAMGIDFHSAEYLDLAIFI
ncbi:hypothetical protein WKW50_00890 [Ochrobactrum sp. GPK 3]|uniref:hypothetical protein n=1 Tax=Brucella sp. 22210 TaxID=3453892 RepID=UPI00313857D7